METKSFLGGGVQYEDVFVEYAFLSEESSETQEELWPTYSEIRNESNFRYEKIDTSSFDFDEGAIWMRELIKSKFEIKMKQ